MPQAGMSGPAPGPAFGVASNCEACHMHERFDFEGEWSGHGEITPASSSSYDGGCDTTDSDAGAAGDRAAETAPLTPKELELREALERVKMLEKEAEEERAELAYKKREETKRQKQVEKVRKDRDRQKQESLAKERDGERRVSLGKKPKRRSDMENEMRRLTVEQVVGWAACLDDSSEPPSTPDLTTHVGAVERSFEKVVTEEKVAGWADGLGEAESHCKESLPILPKHVDVVERSWAKIVSLGVENVGVLLCKNIFEIAPEALGLFSFRNDPDLYESAALKKHSVGVMKVVDRAVMALREFDSQASALRDLGARHVKYGALAAHYDMIGTGLIMTVEQGMAFFSDEPSPDVTEAWSAVFATVAKTMKGGHYKDA